jgi:DNA-binding HxlR family transcriptional regulator
MEDLQFTYIMQLALGCWNSHPLYTLTKLKIFEHLNDGQKSFEELQQATDCSSFSLSSILNVGVTLKLIITENGYFKNSSLAKNYLVSDSPNSLVNWIKLMNRWSRSWTYLEEAIKDGCKAEVQYSKLGGDKEYLNDFMLANHEIALTSLNDFKKNVTVSGTRHLLDIGGGVGTYSIALCQSNPDLTVTLLDLEHVAPIAENIIKKFDLQERIHFKGLDYTVDDFGKDIADTILLSNMLLQEPISITRSIFQKAYEALNSDGELIIQGYFMDEVGLNTMFTSLLNLYAIILWSKNQACTMQDIIKLLDETGYSSEPVYKLKNTGLVIIRAKKKKKEYNGTD